MPKTTKESIPFNLTSLKAKEEFTEEHVRKIFLKNGSTLGILFPKEVKNKMNLQKGNYVFIKANKDMILIRKLNNKAVQSS